VQCEQLHREFKIDIRVLGIASSKKMLFKDTGIDLDNWKEEFDAKV
jgi:aspartokinase/homoserine dehydrogenase 1